MIRRMKATLKKVRATARRHRKRCQRLSKEDPDHICSVDHVRIPPHCRLKRDHKKRVARVKKYTKLELTTKDDNTPIVYSELPNMSTITPHGQL
jgi:hypothetical protein